MDVGTQIINGPIKEQVLDAIKITLAKRSMLKRVMPTAQDYEGNAIFKQVLHGVMSCVDYVNRTVWFKSI